MVASSGPARGAGTRLRRLVVRLLLLAGFTAATWLAGVLLAGSASADIRLPGLPVTVDISSPMDQPKPKQQQSNQGLGGLVGGLLGTVTNTVGTTVTTVTTTVNTTVNVVTNTVTNVVDTVTQIPPKVLPPSNGRPGLPPLLPGNPVKDILSPPNNSDSGDNETAQRDATIAPAPAAVAPAVAPALVQAEPTTQHPLLRKESRSTTRHETRPVRVGNTEEKAAPADPRPRPLPAPAAPAAPAAPGPSFSPGNDGGSGARGVLAILTPQTRVAPPALLDRLQRQHPVAERGRTAGLPVTSPD